MARRIILPRELDVRLNNLAGMVEEVNGILLYRRQEDLCHLEGIFMTGVGEEGHVQAEHDKIVIANEFFRRNPEYKYVKFHTHSIGTITKYGDYYSDHFSEGDIETYKEQLKENKEFIAMLITQKTKLLCGIDNPTLEIVEDYPGFEKRKQAVRDAFYIIKRNLGYDNGPFNARKI